MKKWLWATALLCGLGIDSLVAQEPLPGAVPGPLPGAVPTVNTRAPSWQSSYQQETARDYIRRRAQEKTAARQARIEGMRWLGYSPARPTVSTTPFMSSVPSWTPVVATSVWGPAVWYHR